jgi:hypothetical protein
MDDLIRAFREAANRDFTLLSLKALIIIWAIFVVALAIVVDNKWVLTGILAYEVLP